MASSFFMLGKIRTTEAKAKELRPYVEKFITRAKKIEPANYRYFRTFFSDTVTKKIRDRAKEVSRRKGGYTRIIKLGARRGDSARMAIIELVES